MSTSLRFTVDDLDSFPDDGTRYEVIDGELFVAKAPGPLHQITISRLDRAFGQWDPEDTWGTLLPGVGVIFAVDAGVIPDLVWVSAARWSQVVGADWKIRAAPDLVVEVLSPGTENERRDREVKVKLYSREGVQEYWILDRERQRLQVFRRVNAVLELALTLDPDDYLTSPLLPGFRVLVGSLFPIPAH